VVQGHGISILKVGDHTCDYTFFAQSHVHLSGDLPRFPQIPDTLLKKPGPQHLPVERPEVRLSVLVWMPNWEFFI
jgi:hypothetical protein